MTTITRTRPGPLRWLPLFVPGTLLLVSVLLAPVAPTATSVYRIHTDRFTVTHPDCDLNGTVATCAVPIDGKTLAVTVDTDRARMNVDCTATYGSESTTCARRFGNSPYAPEVAVGLSVPEEAARAVRDSLPWWSELTEGTITLALLCLMIALSLGMAVASWFLSRRPRGPTLRPALMTGFMCVAVVVVPLVSMLVLLPLNRVADTLPLLLMPHLGLAPMLVIVLWQMVVGREITGKVGQRLSLSVTALVVTAVYVTVNLFWIGMSSGLLD
ncbi:hypothetical protein ACQPZF_28630 [Actinosynnema sp. CS-041913]|uniref:hypothetical protein n=1 Tax=Actinosynnema sp. CS-041913 TaxID=3239917 RepID=UPI003D92B33F